MGKINFESSRHNNEVSCRTYWNYSSKNHDFTSNWHNEYEFIYIVSGTETIYIENDYYVATPGDIVAINPGRIHTLTGENWVHHCIIPSEQLLQSIGVDTSATLMSLIRDPELSEVFLNIVKAAATERKFKQQFLQLALQHFLLLVFEKHEMKRFDSEAQKMNPNFAVTIKVIKYLRQHLSETFPIDAISDEIGITSSYMCRCVKAATGLSIIDHLNRLRCYHAKHLLMYTDKKIGEIAALCGYQSNSYFSKTYQKIIGQSPNETTRTQINSK